MGASTKYVPYKHDILTPSPCPFPSRLIKPLLPKKKGSLIILKKQMLYYLRLLDKIRCQTAPGYMHTV